MTRFALSVVLSLWGSVAFAAPVTLSHQGRLLDAAGDPIEGAQTLTITLWSAESGGTAVWTETASHPFSAGFYSVVLGSQSSNALDSSAFDQSLWLGVRVGAAPELSPRIRIHPTALAVRAYRADVAEEAEHAVDADFATEAAHAVDADVALEAEHADEADHATTAGHATTADSATTATTATTAGHATTATTATNLSGGTVAATELRVGGQLIVDGSGVIVGDPTYAVLDDAGCTAAGGVPTWSGTAWGCSVPSDSLAAVTCGSAGQILGWTGTAWTCVTPAVGPLTGCVAGQLMTYTGTAWTCADPDPADIGDAAIAGLGNSDASVGVGVLDPMARLDVDGGVRLGVHGVCDAASEGTLQYDPMLGLQLCRGVWRTVSTFTSGTSCHQLYANGVEDSGPYQIDPDGSGPYPEQTVWCDMDTAPGGWTVLQYDVASAQQTSGHGIPSASPGWSLDYQSATSFWANVTVKDFYIAIDGAWSHTWTDVALADGVTRTTPKYLFSGDDRQSWECGSSGTSYCHIKEVGTGRLWGRWMGLGSCCLGTKGIWYHSRAASDTSTYGLCQDAYPNGQLATGSVATTGCVAGKYTNFSPTGSQRFKYAIRY